MDEILQEFIGKEVETITRDTDSGWITIGFTDGSALHVQWNSVKFDEPA